MSLCHNSNDLIFDLDASPFIHTYRRHNVSESQSQPDGLLSPILELSVIPSFSGTTCLGRTGAPNFVVRLAG